MIGVLYNDHVAGSVYVVQLPAVPRQGDFVGVEHEIGRRWVESVRWHQEEQKDLSTKTHNLNYWATLHLQLGPK